MAARLRAKSGRGRKQAGVGHQPDSYWALSAVLGREAATEIRRDRRHEAHRRELLAEREMLQAGMPVVNVEGDDS